MGKFEFVYKGLDGRDELMYACEAIDLAEAERRRDNYFIQHGGGPNTPPPEMMRRRAAPRWESLSVMPAEVRSGEAMTKARELFDTDTRIIGVYLDVFYLERLPRDIPSSLGEIRRGEKKIVWINRLTNRPM